MLVDFENVLTVDLFVARGAAREVSVVWELCPPPEKLCAEGPEGRYVHELLVPMAAEQ